MPPRVSPPEMCLETAVLTIPKCAIGPPEANNASGDEETEGLNHPGLLHLPWTVVSRVTEVHCRWLLQCCPDQIAMTGRGVPDKVDDVERKPT